jgi:hypothetical protein
LILVTKREIGTNILPVCEAIAICVLVLRIEAEALFFNIGPAILVRILLDFFDGELPLLRTQSRRLWAGIGRAFHQGARGRPFLNERKDQFISAVQTELWIFDSPVQTIWNE